MSVARLLTWLILGTAPLACAAQIVSEQRDVLQGTYFGINVGKSKYHFRDPPAGLSSDFCGNGALDCRDDPIGWKATGGYMIWRWFGIEASAFAMGDANIKFDLGGGDVFTQKVQIQGYGLSAVGAVPLGPVTLNGRAGYAASSGSRRDDVNGGNVFRSRKSRAEPLFGAGLRVRVWRGMFVGLDWDHARARTTLGEKFDADLYSAGIGWAF